MQGERELAKENHSLAKFELWGLPPLLRGMPQIEVTFRIDASGIVSVAAVEKTTGREAKIKIEASGRLSEAEIDKMIQDAETKRANDAELRERIDIVNESKGLVYMAERSLEQMADYLPPDDAEQFKEELVDRREYLENEPAEMEIDDLKAVKKALEQLAQTIAETAFRAMNDKDA